MTLATESSTPNPERNQRQRIKIRFSFLTAVFFVFLTNVLVVVWILFVSNLAPNVTISQPTPPPISLLCPGEVFTYTFLLETDKATSVNLSYSIIPALDSDTSRIVQQEQIYLDRPVALTLTRNWVVPETVPLVTGEVFEWEEGRYYRNVQVSLLAGSTVQGEVNYPFVIKSNCP